MRLSPGLLAVVARLMARIARAGPPPAVSTADRLRAVPVRGLPVRAPVDIRWDEHQVPSIEAANDHDLAVGLGVVHAHLRLAQMEIMRRLATGTVSAAVGPAALDLDRTLRLMRFDAAVPAMEAALPPATRAWAEAFLAGVNHVIGHLVELPYELRVMRLRPARWTLAELLTVSRLAATDVSWLVFTQLLRGRAGIPTAEWAALWPDLQQGDALPWPATMPEATLALMRGSNSAAVSAARSAHGAGLIASDPHLGIMLPPLWLVAGLHAPGLDVVGLMVPGLPVVALGRNAHLAWGGTSLHAASSELVDVSDEPMTERRVPVPVRGGAPREVVLRETRFGPVVSDGLLFPSRTPLALRWVGHRPSDELTAMLGVMRARGLEEFRSALDGFAVPGQTMVAVEAGPSGRAARLIAAHLPRRPNTPMAGLACRPEEVWSLDDLVPATSFGLDVRDVVASANDRPAETPVPVGFFFSLPDRVQRLRALLDDGTAVDLARMRALQLDVAHPGALALRDALLARLPPAAPRQRAAVRALAAWDGGYGDASEGALVFEVLVGTLARRMIPRPTLALLATIWTGRALVAQRVRTAPPRLMAAALRAAARAHRRWGNWGGAHRLALRHPLGALPLVGAWFATERLPVAGGNDTLNKTGHGIVAGRHDVTFGACARHVSDMGDPDANWFALLGGQDGWLGSANAADQVAPWRAGAAVQVPLRAEAARAWPYLTRLEPA